jgi:hypothetical protein
MIERLAKAWDQDPRVLQARLEDYSYGLPRGRVSRPGKQSLVLHGNDAPVANWRDRVLRRFDIDLRSVKFVYDEHETRLGEDSRKVMEALGIDRAGIKEKDARR